MRYFSCIPYGMMTLTKFKIMSFIKSNCSVQRVFTSDMITSAFMDVNTGLNIANIDSSSVVST